MCCIAAKYFKDVGWVGVKNRDRNYKPTVRIRQSFRRGIERLYIWDEKTKYTEGINEFGVCIINSATDVKKDEKEGVKPIHRSATYMAPDGKRIRTALFEKTPELAAKYLIKEELRGNTLIFNKDKCFLLEGTHKEKGRKDWVYKLNEIPKDEIVVRTNHGLLLTWMGYQPSKDGGTMQKSYESSVSRLEVSLKNIKKAQNEKEMIEAISDTSNNDNQLNPLRQSNTHSKHIMVTTGQLLMIPANHTLHYRPIWGNLVFDYQKLDSPKSRTWFEIISSRKLLSVKESIGTFSQFWDRKSY